jgi:cysteinyl-tRNA synthetase
MDNSYSVNNAAGYISFAADHRELDNIPNYPSPIYNENANAVTTLAQAQNFLYLINPDNFATKTAFIGAVTATNYDLLVMDLFFHDGNEFTASEVAQLRQKANGGSRLVICYMSIGEAEDYRYYWQHSWNSNKPSWLRDVNPDWAGNYKVAYWDGSWQQIIYGNNSSYLKKILDADFDGVYLDIIDAYEYFESL